MPAIYRDTSAIMAAALSVAREALVERGNAGMMAAMRDRQGALGR